MITAEAHRLLVDPFFRFDALLVLVVCRRNPMTLQRLQARVICRTHEVHDTIPRPRPLLAGRGDDTMPTRAEHAVRELDRRVAEVDNGTASLRLHPEPFARRVGLERADCARGVGPDLQPTQPVHQQRDRAKISMAGRLDLWHLDRLSRWAAGNAYVVARELLELVPLADLLWVDAELVGEDVENHEARAMCCARVGSEEVLALEDGGGPIEGHLGVRDDHVVFADVEEFGGVAGAG